MCSVERQAAEKRDVTEFEYRPSHAGKMSQPMLLRSLARKRDEFVIAGSRWPEVFPDPGRLYGFRYSAGKQLSAGSTPGASLIAMQGSSGCRAA